MAWGKNSNTSLDFVNAYVGTRLAQLREALADLNDFNSNWMLPNQGATGLQALGMTSADAAQLAACIGDMTDFYKVYYGTATVASGGAIAAGNGHNFDLNAKLGAGISVHT